MVLQIIKAVLPKEWIQAQDEGPERTSGKLYFLEIFLTNNSNCLGNYIWLHLTVEFIKLSKSVNNKIKMDFQSSAKATSGPFHTMRYIKSPTASRYGPSHIFDVYVRYMDPLNGIGIIHPLAHDWWFRGIPCLDQCKCLRLSVSAN